jgi:drug/metabolite transporter (DMT)-like permease
MSKLSITPVLVAIEWIWYSKPASARVLASIVVLMVGVGMCSVSDVQIASNPAGIAAAVGAVLVAALYQAHGRGGGGGEGAVAGAAATAATAGAGRGVAGRGGGSPRRAGKARPRLN